MGYPSLKLSNNVTVSGIYKQLVDAGDYHKYISMEGSSRSTKTYSILQDIICTCLSSPVPLRIGIIRARLTWLKATLLVDFEEILRDQFGLWKESSFNKSEMIYNLNGCRICFIGLDSDAGRQKAHGFKSDKLYFNECTDLDWEPVRQLLIRCTFKHPVVFDFNPNCGDEFWLFKKVLTREKSITIHSTYKDNPWLSQDQIDEIESSKPTPENIARGTADETHWKIYGLGVRSIVKGLVFPHFNIVPSLPVEFDDRCKGMDFGFSNDPTTLIHVAKQTGELYLDEQLWKTGLTSIINPDKPEQPSIQEEFQKLNVTKRIKILADNARPEMIADLCNCGYNVHACTKGAGSILNGIQIMHRYRLNVTERSINLIKEFQNYKWKEGKDGEPTKEPVDKWNHGCDAARYAISGHFSGFGSSTPRFAKMGPLLTGAEKYDAF